MLRALTLDTDVVRDVWDEDERRGPIERLIELAHEGRITLSVTHHIHQDVPWSPLAEKINELPAQSINRAGGVFQLGVSPFGGAGRLGSGAFELWWNAREASRTATDPKLPGRHDSLHLHAHYISGRDAFVTWDRAILRLRDELQEVFGIVVVTPREALDLIL